MADITIFHNPACGTSRNVLALLRHAGLEPRLVEYLKTPPGKEDLRALLRALDLPVRAVLREKEAKYAELGLADPARSDDELLEAIVAHPILLNRPIVVTPLGTKLCRPSEEVLEILPVGRLPPFTKSDGEQVLDHGRRRRWEAEGQKKTATLRWLYQVLGRTSLGDLNPVCPAMRDSDATLARPAVASILLSADDWAAECGTS